MTPFHVGMKVVCLPSAPIGAIKGFKYPVIGGVYTIRGVVITDAGNLALLLNEIVNVNFEHWSLNEPAFRASHFRPAHENRMDELRSLLAPVPSKAKTRVEVGFLMSGSQSTEPVYS